MQDIKDINNSLDSKRTRLPVGRQITGIFISNEYKSAALFKTAEILKLLYYFQ
jgi:hypothetical protein